MRGVIAVAFLQLTQMSQLFSAWLVCVLRMALTLDRAWRPSVQHHENRMALLVLRANFASLLTVWQSDGRARQSLEKLSLAAGRAREKARRVIPGSWRASGRRSY